MRGIDLVERWRNGIEKGSSPRGRNPGTGQRNFWHRLANILTPESFFRLILAFVLSTALWLYVTSRSAPEASVPYSTPIPISAENLPHSLTLTTTLPTVQLDVRPQSIGFQPSSFIASVNLAGFKAGRHTHVPVTPHFPPGTVTSWNPQFVALNLEHIITKTLPVKIDEVNSPPYGFTITSAGLYATPHAVRITGAASYVDEVAQVYVPVELAQARSSLNVDSTPLLRNAQGHSIPSGVAIFPPRVRIHATINQLVSYKTLPIVASIQGQLAAGFSLRSISVSPPDLTTYGPPKALSGLQNLKTSFVDIGGLRSGRKTFHAHLRHPPGVYFGTRSVEVTVTIGPGTGEAETRVAVRAVHIPLGDVAVSQPSQLLISITGPAPALSGAGRKLLAIVNVAGLGEGTFSIKPVIRGGRKVKIVAIQPNVVSVIVRRS